MLEEGHGQEDLGECRHSPLQGHQALHETRIFRCANKYPQVQQNNLPIIQLAVPLASKEQQQLGQILSNDRGQPQAVARVQRCHRLFDPERLHSLLSNRLRPASIIWTGNKSRLSPPTRGWWGSRTWPRQFFHRLSSAGQSEGEGEARLEAWGFKRFEIMFGTPAKEFDCQRATWITETIRW